MASNLEYDKTDPESIEAFSKRLIGKTFREIWEAAEQEFVSDKVEESSADYVVSSKAKRNKGNLGQIIEECFFRYKPNSDARPDFPEAGVELKVTPYKINNNKSYSAKERLILTMIDYFKVVDESFDTSHFWYKSRLILLVYYLFQQGVENLDYRIDFSKLFTPPEQDLKIIKHDFETIVNKIKAGKAHEISEADTLYLGAATKGATGSVRRGQPFSDIPAKPRAFAFKSSYMTYVLNNYIRTGKQLYQPILSKDAPDDFEAYITQKIARYKGYSVDELCGALEISYKNRPKNLESNLAFRILGVTSNQAEEFVKANIVVKTIRINQKNRIKEHMSFPTFKFKELVLEEWEDSTFGDYLRETRFFFVVFKEDSEGVLRLRGAQFWNMPFQDIENEVKPVWERTKQVLIDGLEIKVVKGITYNNFPKGTESRVSHVRPHARDKNDTYELPDGRSFPKQCFWLNNTYIYEQINDSLKG